MKDSGKLVTFWVSTLSSLSLSSFDQFDIFLLAEIKLDRWMEFFIEPAMSRLDCLFLPRPFSLPFWFSLCLIKWDNRRAVNSEHFFPLSPSSPPLPQKISKLIRAVFNYIISSWCLRVHSCCLVSMCLFTFLSLSSFIFTLSYQNIVSFIMRLF